MIPKVSFEWSWIYQTEIGNLNVKEEYDHGKDETYVLDFIEKVEEQWKPLESKVFIYMSDLTGLDWKKGRMDCFVLKIGAFTPISHPLTIPIKFQAQDGEVFALSVERYVDMLVHELIHNLFIQNEKKLAKYFEYLFDHYKEEPFNTILHLPVHAIHEKIFYELFNKGRLEAEKEACKDYSDYNRSWEVVSKEGADSILKKMKEFYSN
jgi:hypothetical protein